jgi:uncharacterized coiled-coil DUF342 family protein
VQSHASQAESESAQNREHGHVAGLLEELHQEKSLVSSLREELSKALEEVDKVFFKMSLRVLWSRGWFAGWG